LFIGLTLSFLIIPVLRFSNYGKLVTGLRQKSAQLLASRRATTAVIQSQNDFVPAVSHELRNPIHAISLVVNAFDEEELASHTSHLTLHYVSKSVSDLLRTIDNLLIFSQIQAHKLHLNYELIDLSQWMLSAKRNIRDLTRGLPDQDSEIEVHCEVDPNLPAFLDTDPVRLCHVIRELVSNAAKFSDRKPISVTMRRNTSAKGGAPLGQSPSQTKVSESSRRIRLICTTDSGLSITPTVQANAAVG
jgi:signal transduction histidine kinase